MLDPIELQPSSVASRIKMVRVPSGARKQVVFRLVDADGKPVELTKEVRNFPAEEPRFGAQRPVGGDVTVRLRVVDEAGSQPVLLDLVGKVLDGYPDMVEFLIDNSATTCPGVYTASVGQFQGPNLIQVWPCYVCIEASAFQTLSSNSPLTVPEVRLALSDVEVSESSLLDDVEFTDVQIAAAMRRVVSLWNDTPPNVDTHSGATFPYREMWLIGTMSYLLDMAAAKYRRNRLTYSAGGVSIDDQNKAPEYQQMAQQYKAEFMEWMRREKNRLNMEASWGTF